MQQETNLSKGNESKIRHTTSILKELQGSFPPDGVMLLVTCCNLGGGLYGIRFTGGAHQVLELFSGNIRGIAAYDGGFIFASNAILFKTDPLVRVIQTQKIDEIDIHGIAVRDGVIFAMQTHANAVGMYDLETMQKLDEIKLFDSNEDVLHANDIFVTEDSIYVTMMRSPTNYQSPMKSRTGVMVRIDRQTKEVKEQVMESLWAPHSILKEGEDIYTCSSADFAVRKNDDILFQASGYLRGFAKIGDVLFAGQSTCRNLPVVRRHHPFVSLNTGVHVYHQAERVSMFIPLPAPAEEVYGILPVYNEEIFTLKRESFRVVETPAWQVFFNVDGKWDAKACVTGAYEGTGFEAVDYEILLDNDYAASRVIRFDPIGGKLCMVRVRQLSYLGEDGAWSPLSIARTNASFALDDEYYFFQTDDPQFYFEALPQAAGKLSLRFDMITGREAMMERMVQKLNKA